MTAPSLHPHAEPHLPRRYRWTLIYVAVVTTLALVIQVASLLARL